VTCEVAPHHFTLTDEALGTPIPYDTNTKMNPPLREAADREAMLQEFDRAPFGIVGLETAVPLAFDRLVHSGLIRVPRLVELLSVNPARILRIPGGTLSEGAPADITILAPDMKVRVQAARLRSRSRNTPFDGWELRGGVAATLVGGRTVFRSEELALTV
jgi:dihydroorotase